MDRVSYLAILGFVLLVYAKTLYWMVGSWIMNPYYSHGSLVVAISAYLAYRTCRAAEVAEINTSPGGNKAGLFLFSSALLIHALSYLYSYYWISAFSLPFAIFGCLYFLNEELARKLAFPVFFLLLAVPYPIYGISNRLEVFSALAASKLLDLIGIKTTLVGAEITTAKNSFVVGAPCSGIRSILALATVSAFYTYLVRAKLAVKAVLLLSSVPLAMLANVLRIVSVIASAEYFGLKFSMDYVHPMSDLVFFIFAVLILIGAEKLLRRVIA